MMPSKEILRDLKKKTSMIKFYLNFKTRKQLMKNYNLPSKNNKKNINEAHQFHSDQITTIKTQLKLVQNQYISSQSLN